MVARVDRSGSELCFLEETVFPRHEGTSTFNLHCQNVQSMQSIGHTQCSQPC